MFFSAVLQAAVKKGPNARGGLVWKTHAFWKVSKTRKVNVLKKLKFLNANDAVLKEAASVEATQAAAPAAAVATEAFAADKSFWPKRLREKIMVENANMEMRRAAITGGGSK